MFRLRQKLSAIFMLYYCISKSSQILFLLFLSCVCVNYNVLGINAHHKVPVINNVSSLCWFSKAFEHVTNEYLSWHIPLILHYGVSTGSFSNYVGHVLLALKKVLQSITSSSIYWLSTEERHKTDGSFHGFQKCAGFVDGTKQKTFCPTDDELQNAE